MNFYSQPKKEFGFFSSSLLLLLSLNSAHASGSLASVAGFGGFKNSHSQTHLALGVEGEVSMLPLIGATAFFERTNQDVPESSAGIGLTLHPIPDFGLRLMAAPGVEWTDQSSHLLLRVGAAYEFECGPLFWGPTFNVDFVAHSNNKVFGVLVGIGL
jgi:hypothetical protein